MKAQSIEPLRRAIPRAGPCTSTLPTAEEAAVIRDKLYIPKKREISEEERARLAGMGHRFSSRRDDVVDEIRPPTSPQTATPAAEGQDSP
jgi:hypothetical protein